VVRADVWASDSALLVGHTLQLHVTAWDSAGRVVTPTAVTWWTGDTAKVTVDANGLVTARAGGDVDLWVQTAPLGIRDTLPVHVAVHGELKWRLSLGLMPTEGGAAEGPDGTVYVLTIDGYPDERGTLYAISPRGAIRWSRPLNEVRNNWPIVGPDGSVYVVGQYVYAFNPDGSLRWSITDRPADLSTFPQYRCGALSAGGVLFAAMGHDLFALLAATGDTLWIGPRSLNAAWLQPPTVSADQQTVYIGLKGRYLTAFDAASGAERWRALAADGGIFDTGPAVAQDRLYVPGMNSLQQVSAAGTIVATGLTGVTDGPGVTEPAIGPDGTLYLQARTARGFADVSTPLWLFGGADRRYPLAPASPALAEGGVLYAAGQTGLYALDVSAAGATLHWRYPPGPFESLVFTGAPLIGRDGTVYSFTTTTAGQDNLPSTDEFFAFWEDHPVERNSPWPMWRHDARRSGQAGP
jgi:outer membrane protein assembly factor BamB